LAISTPGYYFHYKNRKDSGSKWDRLMVNGAMDLILAGIAMTGLSGTPVRAPGRLVGINMVFGAATRIVMAVDARELAEA
jgi:uncharacterized membrane protein HdeD (DUF308 family)